MIGSEDRAEKVYDHRRALAAAVWVSSVGYGTTLGAAGAAGTVAVALVAGADPRTAAIVAVIAGVLGAGFGFVAGNLVGVALGLLVTFGHRRLGVRVVSTLMPLTAMLVTQPSTYAIFHTVATPAIVVMALLDALLTLLGARAIARRYRRLARSDPRVH